MLNPQTPAFEPNLKPQYASWWTSESMIQNVWKYNLKEEIQKISQLVEKYNYIAMDTEFPGIIVRVQGDFRDAQYQQVRHNVDSLKLIQLGVTLSDDKGNRPQGICTWQFNFEFDTMTDTHAEDSIILLKNSGIDFESLTRDGISAKDFAEYFTVSGLTLNEEVTYLTFHSGYDFAYLLKQLTCQRLPETQGEFYKQLELYFPNFYDLKHVVRGIDKFRGGLNRIAEEVGVKRVGRMHQAGSDSLVTLETYFKVRDEYFALGIEDHKNIICGLNGGGREDYAPSFT